MAVVSVAGMVRSSGGTVQAWEVMVGSGGSSGGQVSCPVCGKVLSNKYNLRIHVRDKHEAQAGSGPTCSTCHRTFKNQNSLRVHSIKQHGTVKKRKYNNLLYDDSIYSSVQSSNCHLSPAISVTASVRQNSNTDFTTHLPSRRYSQSMRENYTIESCNSYNQTETIPL